MALCGISTGLFAFPTSIAAKTAVDTVTIWIAHNEETSITEIMFVTFAEGDYDVYNNLILDVSAPWQSQNPQSSQREELSLEYDTLKTARGWLESADTIIVSAGAGLSAADGLDYTSRTSSQNTSPPSSTWA